MNFNTIAFSILITLLVSSLGTNYYVFSKNSDLQKELALVKFSNSNLQAGIERQNAEIKMLETRNNTLFEKYSEIETKYDDIKSNANDTTIQNAINDYARKHNISNKDAFCRIQLDIIEKGLDEFYKK